MSTCKHTRTSDGQHYCFTASVAVHPYTHEITAVMAAHKLSRKEVARQSGVKSARLIPWLNGNYTGDNERVEAELLRWLESYQTRRAAADALPAAPDITPPAGNDVTPRWTTTSSAWPIRTSSSCCASSRTWPTRHWPITTEHANEQR